MFYEDSFIDGLIENPEFRLDPASYAPLQARNVAKMLDKHKSWYRLFGVYWWHVKDALRKYVAGDKWYRGNHDDPLMKERAWHGSEFRTMLAAMFYMNEHPLALPDCEWFDKYGNRRRYSLYDPDTEM